MDNVSKGVVVVKGTKTLPDSSASYCFRFVGSLNTSQASNIRCACLSLGELPFLSGWCWSIRHHGHCQYAMSALVYGYSYQQNELLETSLDLFVRCVFGYIQDLIIRLHCRPNRKKSLLMMKLSWHTSFFDTPHRHLQVNCLKCQCRMQVLTLDVITMMQLNAPLTKESLPLYLY